MWNIFKTFGMVLLLSLAWIDSSYALDSYRFLHVTIDTPWTIFLFLLCTIFAPFILMAILVWRYAERKRDTQREREIQAEAEK